MHALNVSGLQIELCCFEALPVRLSKAHTGSDILAVIPLQASHVSALLICS